ncbi:MAG: hypothetical protein C6W58_02090 [Bacillaceae bacterium]|jgi:hypothetical protein|uniref:YtpI-like protein n=2 Tax=Aeribacillus TaxID=1055323 RepID=A0A165YJ60_9BACI|nr:MULTISPECIES: YtpI family protein [Aeribacillus]REJ20747.1 MAG: hypothetical protein C6W58_02090 [Bacillaceae bacterium]ASS92148.1 hypothetical protein AP3564_19425 [Aeribacillus pallidus]KZN97135.1 hypothetical protein AZI98_06145 [Aeribacillus pallidus]MDR9791647.1 YtpI family protein [Aeribacillus pallidus]MDR9796787.1 YtpI family protein [Aeribacillus pallidus]
MPVLAILTVISLSFYVFYKIKYFRTKRPMERSWISSKSSISLGLFVFFFGLNQMFLNRSTVALIVGVVFIITGCLSIWAGYKAYKYYLPLAIKESENAR